MRKPFKSAGKTCTAILSALVIVALATLIGAEVWAKSGSQSVLRLPANIALPASRTVTIGLNKSMIVELPRDVRDVLVSDPKKLDAVVHTGRRAYLIGVAVGQANVFFFAKDGQQMLTLEVRIERDLSAVSKMLHRLLPGSNIKLEAVNDNVVLTGSVRNASDASRAADIAGRLVDDEDNKKIVNMLNVESKEQVLLKVTVAELQRNVIKQLGVDLDVLLNGGSVNFAKLSTLRFPFTDGIQQSVAQSGLSWTSGANRAQAVIQALEQNNVLRTLAEPTLTAISGETASFLAGGEFPVPVSQDGDRISVEFKPFGIGLSFTPVVMSEGRISLAVSTEVSELTNEGAVTLAAITIPALKVRRANTTVELPSGGSIAIAGLISDETKQAMTGYPGLKNLPVLGALFRSRDFEKSETELVVLVTPYVVDPTSRSKLSRPDDGFAPASDAKTNLLGHMNRIYGRRPEDMPSGTYKGEYGFIIE